MNDNTLTLELSYEEFVIIESLLIDRLDEMKENIELVDENEYVKTSSLRGAITGLVDILEANIEYNNDTDDDDSWEE